MVKMLLHLWNAARDRHTVLPVAATLLGVVMVVAGWVIQGEEYIPGMLQQFGSALVMLMPLLFLGRLLEVRMRRTEERTRSISTDLARIRSDVSATAAKIDALNAMTREDIERLDKRREEMFADAERTPAQDNVAQILSDAKIVGAIAAEGVRVRVPDSHTWLRFRAPASAADTAHLSVVLEHADARPFAHLSWHAGEPAETLAMRIASELTPIQQGLSEDGVSFARQLIRTVHTAVAARLGESPFDLGSVIELPNDQWAISTDGLHCTERLYHISVVRLLDQREDWPRHMRTKDWVRQKQFAEAYELALHLLGLPPKDPPR
jgi:plasmid stabilization system protein ParE